MNVIAFIVFCGAVWGESLAAKMVKSDAVRRNDCYAEEKIYHKETNKCYRLLTKGPCSKGHWFVLEKPNSSWSDDEIRIQATCTKEKCRDGEYYWKDTGSCVKAYDSEQLCREEEEIRYNLFGEGECQCTSVPPRARLNNDYDNPCHELYTRGPCRSGEVLGYRSRRADEPTCIPDPCYQESKMRKRAGRLAKDAVLAPWRNNTCYELGTKGPCPEGFMFKVLQKSKRIGCGNAVDVYAIFTASSPVCYLDINNSCQTKVTKKPTGNKYLKELTDVLQRSRKKRSH